MANCLCCRRVRPKHEPKLAAAGFVECRASDDAGLILKAFDQFVSLRRVDEPFVVEAAADHLGAAWPLQFLPDSIAQCDGYCPEPMPSADPAATAPMDDRRGGHAIS